MVYYFQWNPYAWFIILLLVTMNSNSFAIEFEEKLVENLKYFIKILVFSLGSRVNSIKAIYISNILLLFLKTKAADFFFYTVFYLISC